MRTNRVEELADFLKQTIEQYKESNSKPYYLNKLEILKAEKVLEAAQAELQYIIDTCK